MDFLKSLFKIVFLLSIILYSCRKDDFDSRPFTVNPIIPGTKLIGVREFSYSINGVTYFIVGDSSSVNSIDSFPSTPSFSWTSTGEELVALAIFNSRIEANTNGIVNPKNIIWMWHTGLTTGIEGSINYLDGRSVDNEILLGEGQLKPLDVDSLYTWAIWAWDASGTKIIKSSREFGFIVK